MFLATTSFYFNLLSRNQS